MVGIILYNVFLYLQFVVCVVLDINTILYNYGYNFDSTAIAINIILVIAMFSINIGMLFL